ncbi:VOC family protein [Halobium salinum]|uniref:VOC family protein n=1 Tax=Halobium salinum TaxID=1364940 RepID=A0ABD5PGS6_9EURY|nr:VOC family protein [Halobium salinum]
MRSSLAHLALEVTYLDRARAFYVDHLGLDPVRETDTEVVFRVGDAELVLRRPTAVPRGGLHVHYAFSTPNGAFETWRERFADLDPEEYEFGSYRSIYVDDPDGHCVEVGDNAERSSASSRVEPDDDAERSSASNRPAAGDNADRSPASGPPEAGDEADRREDAPPLTDIFEIVLEVEDLDAAVALYETLGFEPYDRGENRRRVRLAGPFDLELWEPQLGLADARGGVHVDLALRVADPEATVVAVADRVGEAVQVDTRHGDGLRVRDPDGHYLTFVGGAGD